MRIDYVRAKTVFAVMLAQYLTRQYPYHNLEDVLPQTLVTPQLRACSLQHALHLFVACHWMRGTVQSSVAFRFLNHMHLEHPWLFRPEVVAFVPAPEIAEVIGQYHQWHKEQLAVLWQHNARVLNERFAGDPRRIFAGVRSASVLYRRVMGRRYDHSVKTVAFRGFLEKMTSMLAYFLEAERLITPTELSAPIDFHHLRVYLATEMIVIEGDRVRYEKVKASGIRLARWLQREFSLSQVEYGDIVWVWSLRSCRQAPCNACTGIRLPNGREIRNPIPVTWTDTEVATYNQTCGRCAIASYCRWGIPAGVYYTLGHLEKISRTEPPQLRLFTPEDLPSQRRSEEPFRARF